MGIMKIAFIAPVENLDLMDIGGYYFALPHLATDEYVKKLKNSDRYIMVDNSSFEGERPDGDTYLEFCYEINADEVIALDSLKDPDSFYMSRNFITEYGVNQDFKVQVVPQDINPSKWLQTCKRWSKYQDLFDVLGIPIWLYSEYGKRNYVFEVLLKKQWFEDDIKYHFLGLDKVEELVRFNRYIDSVDTSLPITLAHHGKKLKISEGSRESRVNLKSSVENVELAKENCRKLQEFLIKLQNFSMKEMK